MAEAMGATLWTNGDAALRLQYIAFDTRQLVNGHATLFFALLGQRDGHTFLADAYRRGVRCFVVSQNNVEVEQLPQVTVLRVPDTLRALQQLAAHHRRAFTGPVVGITGSNGKTIVKEWLSQMLHNHYQVARSPRSYNSQIGVPLSVWELRPKTTLGIFEAGVSEMGEMVALGNIIAPTLGIFTNIGPAHQEGFANEKAKIAEKMQLFGSVSALIVCAAHTSILEAAQKWQQARPGRQLYAWHWEGETWHLDHWAYSLAHFTWKDAASLENIGHCLAAMAVLGVPVDDWKAALRRVEPVSMRLEVKAGVNRCTVVDDAYSNDLAALRIALPFAARQTKGRPLTLILSDILQSGETPEVLYAQVAELIEAHNIQRLIGIGSEVKALQALLPDSVHKVFFEDTSTLLQHIGDLPFHDEVILLKGARAFTFERVAHRLEQKAHKTVLEVNLSALLHNLKAYTQLLRPTTKVLAMVKAAAYGSGSAEVARLLEGHRVDYLGVAYADEGIELRQAGVQLPILVLNPEPASFDAMYRYRLEPEIYSLSLLESVATLQKRMGIHLKLDTGMHRLGFTEAEIPTLGDRLRQWPHLTVQSVFTHLSASDNPQYDAFTHEQADAFERMYEPLSVALGYRPLRHVVNTNGIVRFPTYHFDMVRVGIGLYGVGPQLSLRTVLTLKATVSQVKEVPAGHTVGYNRNGPVRNTSTIATISIGYADGFLRLAGNGRYAVNIRGHMAATIGNVCMDMTMVDVTHIPDVREGDEVVIFGEHPTVGTLADCLQTIPYEVFTNVAARVKRVYYQE